MIKELTNQKKNVPLELALNKLRVLIRSHAKAILNDMKQYVNTKYDHDLKLSSLKVIDQNLLLNQSEHKNSSILIKRIVETISFDYQHIALIHLLFPKAVILNIVRDPLDTLFSLYTT